jgi:hypothetical protein
MKYLQPATREKIQNYLDALKERYSNTELRSIDFKEIRKEFGVSALISTVLKQNGMIGISDNKVILFDRIYRTNATEVHKKIQEYSADSAQRRKKRNYKKKQKTLFEPKNQPKTNLVPKKAGRPKVSRVKCFERTKLIIDTESAKLGLSELHFVEKILSFYLDSSSDSSSFVYKEGPTDFVNLNLIKQFLFKKAPKTDVNEFLKMIDSYHEGEKKEQKMPKLKLLEPTKKLKKLDENLYDKNGYACPKCSNELYDTSDLIINSQKQIHCECGYVGHRKV